MSNNSEPIKAGDVVKLKSGEILMTVEFIDKPSAYCAYELNGEVKQQYFHITALEKVR